MRFSPFVVLVSLFSCGSTPAPMMEMKPQPLSFAAKIRPIFNAKCNACHYAGNLSKLDLTRPFSETEGLLNRDTVWAPRARLTKLVVPGKPEESFLMTKIDPSLALAPANEGARMPINTIANVTAAELADIRTWISNGAMNDAFFQSNVQPIFGTAANLGRAIGKCSYCHTATSLNSPAVNVFGARGLVNVNSSFGGKRVLPGDPDASSLVKKLADTVPTSLGQKMPINYPALTQEEIDLVRQWITEGALDN